MTLHVFACDRIHARLSATQCGRLWRAANGPTAATAKGQHVRMPRSECVRCEIGDAHARGASAPGVELIPAAALLAPSASPPSPHPTETTENTMATNPTYTAQQKEDAVRRLEGGERAVEIATELGCSDSAIYLWRDQILGRSKSVRSVAREKAAQKAARRAQPTPRHAPPKAPDDAGPKTHAGPSSEPVSTPAAPRSINADVVAFLCSLPTIPWAVGDAIRLLAAHAIDGDPDDVRAARARIDAHLRALEEVA